MPTAILALGVMLSAFLLGLIFGGPYIQLLRQFGIGQNIRREGPSRDFAKQGIPTMGGALFIIVVAILWAFVWFLLPQSERDSYFPQTIVPRVVSMVAAYFLFESIVISCHNPIRREIARVGLERLISDGRIHPGRIEEVVRKAENEVEESIKEAGQWHLRAARR